MANENQKRHLRGAPASMGGKFAPNEKADSGRDMLDERLANVTEEARARNFRFEADREMSDLLNRRDIATREMARLMEEARNESHNSENSREFENQRGLVWELSEEILDLAKSGFRVPPSVDPSLPKPDLSKGVKSCALGIEKLYSCAVFKGEPGEYIIKGDTYDLSIVETRGADEKRDDGPGGGYRLTSFLGGVPSVLSLKDSDDAAERIRDWCVSNLER